MASTADTRPARNAGIHALTRSVTSESTAETISDTGSTAKESPSPTPSSAENPAPVSPSTAAVPPMPSSIPHGMPTAPSSSASTSTDRRSWRLEAPSDASSPNWRVRSATEIENEL